MALSITCFRILTCFGVFGHLSLRRHSEVGYQVYLPSLPTIFLVGAVAEGGGEGL